MNSLSGYAGLVRPVNMLLCFVSVLCGALSSGKPLSIIAGFFTDDLVQGKGLVVLSAALSASLILAAGNAFNDVCDVICDRINSPSKPLISGKVTRRTALLFASGLATAGLVLSVPLGKSGILIAIVSVVILWLYDLKFKRTPLIGNIAVAFLGGLAFIYGGVAGGNSGNAFLPAIFAGIFHLSREMIKDAQDYRGDMLAGVRTIATVYGIRVASGIARLILGILAIILLIPFLTGEFGAAYLIAILAGVYPVLAISILLISDPLRSNFARASKLLKAGMPLGILALLAGFQGW